MKPKINLFLFLVFIFLQLQSNAQTNWQKGFVVTGKDTLRGFIDQREWPRNPHEFTFQKTVEERATTKFTALDVDYFQIDGGVQYQRYVTLISMDMVGLSNQGASREAPVRDTLFLEILRKGKHVTLLSYRDDIKTRYFLADGGLQELIYQMHSDGGKFYTNEAYKTQLILAANKAGVSSENLNWLMKKVNYTKNSLIRVVNEINGASEDAQTKRSTRDASLSLYAGAGLGISSLAYQGDSPWKASASSSASYNPYFSVGLDLIFNPAVGKLKFRLDLSMSSTKFNTTSARSDQTAFQTVDYTFNQHNITMSPQVIYNLYNRGDLKIYFGLGLGIHNSSYSNNLYTITTYYPEGPFVTQIPDFLVLNKLWFSYQALAGVFIKKRIELAISYSNSFESLNQNFTPLWSESLSSARVGVNFHFLRN